MFKQFYLRFAALCAEQILCFMRPGKFCLLCARQVLRFTAICEKMRYFGKFRFIYRHKKSPWRYGIKPYCQGCINSLHGSTLIFHSGLLNPPFNAGIRQRLLRRKIGSGSALRLGSGFRLRLRIRNSQQIVSLSECGCGSYSLRQRFCYSCLFLPQKILFVNDLRQLNAYFYFCLHIRRKKAVKPPQNRHIFGIFRVRCGFVSPFGQIFVK